MLPRSSTSTSKALFARAQALHQQWHEGGPRSCLDEAVTTQTEALRLLGEELAARKAGTATAPVTSQLATLASAIAGEANAPMDSGAPPPLKVLSKANGA